ncbi:I78 family peptidase inhibitor [Enterobacterales bacterium AW_CKDN230030176-1A_HGKHYDSX7]
MFHTRASLATLLVAAALTGCSTGGGGASDDHGATPAPTTAENDGRCSAAGADFAMGKAASAVLLEQARKASGAQYARILKPDDLVTLEYRSERLNLNVDRQGRVTRVNCG